MSNKAKKPGRFKSAVLDWLGVNEWMHSTALVSNRSDAGITVTADKALTLSAVWACTRLVSQTIATLPIDLYETQSDGSRKALTNDSIARLIHTQPNRTTTAVMFWEAIVGQALLVGNGFAEKKRIGSRIVALEILQTDRLSWQCKSDGTLLFTYLDDFGQRREIPEQDIFHVPGFSLGGRFGMSAIRYGAEVFGSALAGNQVANSTFKNGLMPTTYFKMSEFLKPGQREEFRTNMEKLTGSLNSGKTPLLEGGMEVGQVGINPTDAQLLESRAFSIEEVCRWFGVPPSMVGSTDKASSWASSSEQMNLWFLQYGLRPWLKRIEEAIKLQLLSPERRLRIYAEFTVDGLLRADTTARNAAYTSSLQNGWRSRNEVRALENLPPIEGGDKYTVQVNLTPLEALQGVPQTQPPTGANDET